ncbi:MAG: hypothetical protein IJI67_04350 [Clostridia bacterium]|nr:hypothetical protein [Clostridia bacterium]
MKKDVLIVLTTSNPEQNALDNHFLPKLQLPCRVTTVCDNECKNSIGSGGAVLQVLQRYYELYDKIIIINSGGYSKRVINYSLRGKGFARLHRGGEETTLLECIAANAYRLSRQFEKGVIVCCSDILAECADAPIDFYESVGFCVEADVQTGSRHGVMFADTAGYLKDYLHKKPPQQLLKMAGGTDAVLLDTGMVYFNKETADILYRFSNETDMVAYLKSSGEQFCLYEDVVSLFSLNCNKEQYLSNGEKSSLSGYKARLFDLLGAQRMKVCSLKEDFIHFGTMRETLANIHRLSGHHHIFHSLVSEDCRVAPSAVLDNVQLSGTCAVGENCLVSDVQLADVTIPADTSVCGLKLKDGSFVCLVTSVFENPKDIIAGQETWNLPRFYKAESFEESYRCFAEEKGGEKLSIQACLEQADYDFCLRLFEYLDTHLEQQRFGKYLEYRERIVAQHFKTLPQFDFSQITTSRVQVSLPIRVNLAGTWSDAMPYCIDHGGNMLNMALSCEGTLPIQVIAQKQEEAVITFERGGKTERFAPGAHNELSDFHLFYAVLKTLGIESARDCGSGFRLSVQVSDLDRGSGLGVSSIVLAGCFIALDRLFGLGLSREQIVAFVFTAEQVMGTGGGWQDQIGALYPGLKLSASAPGIEQNIQVSPVPVSQNIRRLIDCRSVLIPTGIEHFGKSIVGDVMQRYLSGNEECLPGFESIQRLNASFLEAVRADDTEAFCACVNRHAAVLKTISGEIYTAQVEAMAKALAPYTEALSICGAGGGGYFYAVLKEQISPQAFKEKWKEFFPSLRSAPKQLSLFLGDCEIEESLEERD